MIEITCRCGHHAGWDDFRSVWTGKLPAGEFQCPSCSRAWTVEYAAPRVLDNGFIIPGESRVVDLEPVLLVTRAEAVAV